MNENGDMTVTDRVSARLHVRRSLPPPEERAHLRKTAGLTQQEIADALGVTRSTVAQWERGARNPSGPHLDGYLEALRVLAANPSA